MSALFTVTNPDAYATAWPLAACDRWPLAGAKLTPQLKQTLGLPDDLQSDGQPISRIVIKGTSQDYLLSNHYLIPYYSPHQDKRERGDLKHRNEELIIDRARSFTYNAQPELGAIRSREQINQDLGKFLQMPEDTHPQRQRKAARFKIVVGAIITRFETLGRIINQGNSQGARIEYMDIHATSENIGQVLTDLEAGLDQKLADIRADATMTNLQRESATRTAAKTFSAKLRERLVVPPERIDELKEELRGYYMLLTNESMKPLLRTVLFTDKKVDRDGVLIDQIREIGKPLRIEKDMQEDFVRGGIIQKIGDTMESIDDLHRTLVRAMTEKPTSELFEASIQKFMDEQGEQYGIASVNDVLVKLDEFAASCRARAGVRSDDDAYTDVFVNKAVLWGFFMGENGLLQSMRRVGRNMGPEVSELRDIMARGLRIMERSAYTRTPCNAQAPEIWIPNLSADAPPMEHYISDQFMNDRNRTRAEKILGASEGLSPKDADYYLKRKFCSAGVLKDDLDYLREQVKGKSDRAQDGPSARR